MYGTSLRRLCLIAIVGLTYAQEPEVESFDASSPSEEKISGDETDSFANDFTTFFADLFESNEEIKDILTKELDILVEDILEVEDNDDEKIDVEVVDGWKIVAVDDVPTQWPVIFAAIPPGLDWKNQGPPNFQDADSRTYTWTFDVEDGPAECTSEGMPHVDPCVGKVVQRPFANEGVFQVTLTVTSSDEDDVVITQDFSVVKKFDDKYETRRYELRDVPIEQWVLYVKALYAIKASRIYDHLVQIHAESFELARHPDISTRTAGHGGPSFLPWHRAFIRMFEKCLQHVSGDPTMGIPYWDWTLDADKDGGLESEVFSDEYFGPGGTTTDNGFLSSGVFCGSPQETTPSCVGSWYIPESFSIGINLRRQIGREGALPTAADLETIMQLTDYDNQPFMNKPSEPPGFRCALEGWQGGEFKSAHNGVHQWVGGTMFNVFYASGDPIFFSHHAQVDRLYHSWQALHECYVDCYRPQAVDPGVTSDVTGAEEVEIDGELVWRLRGQHVDDLMEPFGIPIADMVLPDNEWKVGNVVYMSPGSKFEKQEIDHKKDDKDSSDSSKDSNKDDSNTPAVPGTASSASNVVPVITLCLLMVAALI